MPLIAMDSGMRSNRLVNESDSEEVEFEERDPTGQYIRYKEVLAVGAFKTVYKAFDEVSGLEVAWVKADIDDVFESEEQLQKLLSEVRLLKSLDHDNIIKMHDYWVDDMSKTFNMITETFTSGNLRQYRCKHKSVDMKAIKNWARQILRGLIYLHSHNPPIVLRDLKCDNVFINGNCGEVKIGDLRLAIVMQQPTVRSFVGCSEFMAPELYDGEYNELVDIYSFGMCMLEMVTCVKPYSECKNPAQVYKKISDGVRPDSLGRVSDPQVKQFIEKCLAKPSIRLSAMELLNDPFLVLDNSKKPKLMNSPKPAEVIPTERNIDKKGLCFSTIEIQRIIGTKELSLKGKKGGDGDNSVLLTLRITDSSGGVMRIEFAFYLDADTATSIAGEMVEQLNLSNEDVTVVAELIDDLIVKIVPGWNSSSTNVENQDIKELVSSDIPLVDTCSGGVSNNMSLSIITPVSIQDKDNDYEPELKVELDAIDRRFQQCFSELLSRRNEAVVILKERWIS